MSIQIVFETFIFIIIILQLFYNFNTVILQLRNNNWKLHIFRTFLNIPFPYTF